MELINLNWYTFNLVLILTILNIGAPDSELFSELHLPLLLPMCIELPESFRPILPVLLVQCISWARCLMCIKSVTPVGHISQVGVRSSVQHVLWVKHVSPVKHISQFRCIGHVFELGMSWATSRGCGIADSNFSFPLTLSVVFYLEPSSEMELLLLSLFLMEFSESPKLGDSSPLSRLIT